MTGRLVVMGSGETAPTMAEVHRAVLRAAGDPPVPLLDTPYGFQENADEITVWAQGLDVLGALTGLCAAVIPHYDNAEGGTHDTRFCYLGERRLRALEASLPADVHVIGVDEHTALVLDLGVPGLPGGSASVLGRGGVTVRVAGASRTLPRGPSSRSPHSPPPHFPPPRRAAPRAPR